MDGCSGTLVVCKSSDGLLQVHAIGAVEEALCMLLYESLAFFLCPSLDLVWPLCSVARFEGTIACF